MITVCKNKYEIFYEPELDGGGKDIAITTDYYIDYIRQNVGKVDTIFEWCCGPAFIGFRLLEEGLCSNLVLADKNKDAIDYVHKTIEHNNISNVTTYVSDNFKNIPKQHFNLIVGNPPFYSKKRTLLNWNENLYVDLNWNIHKDFYNNVTDYISNDSSIILVEHPNQSDPSDFEDMITNNDMYIKDVKLIPTVWDHDLYILWNKLNA